MSPWLGSMGLRWRNGGRDARMRMSPLGRLEGGNVSRCLVLPLIDFKPDTRRMSKLQVHANIFQQGHWSKVRCCLSGLGLLYFSSFTAFSVEW